METIWSLHRLYIHRGWFGIVDNTMAVFIFLLPVVCSSFLWLSHKILNQIEIEWNYWWRLWIGYSYCRRRPDWLFVIFKLIRNLISRSSGQVDYRCGLSFSFIFFLNMWVGWVYFQLIQFWMGSLCISCHIKYGNYEGISHKVKVTYMYSVCGRIYIPLLVSREFYLKWIMAIIF